MAEEWQSSMANPRDPPTSPSASLVLRDGLQHQIFESLARGMSIFAPSTLETVPRPSLPSSAAGQHSFPAQFHETALYGQCGIQTSVFPERQAPIAL
ncbi:hypothetical protein VTO73DRAFT_11183 [Trametes versicolor]